MGRIRLANGKLHENVVSRNPMIRGTWHGPYTSREVLASTTRIAMLNTRATDLNAVQQC